jgi:hypothetical protein
MSLIHPDLTSPRLVEYPFPKHGNQKGREMRIAQIYTEFNKFRIVKDSYPISDDFGSWHNFGLGVLKSFCFER